MRLGIYLGLFAIAVIGTAMLVKRLLPYDIGGGFLALVWIRLIPASYNVEKIQRCCVVTQEYPGLAFLSIAGLAAVALVIFGSVTSRMSREVSFRG